MIQIMNSFKRIVAGSLLALSLISAIAIPACSTAPSKDDRTSFLTEARQSKDYFTKSISGLSEQLKTSAGYAVFPGIGKWGVLFGGGEYGRGAVFAPDGTQIGWAAMNNPNIGLQVGGQGMQMIIVFETKKVLEEFKANTMAGSASGTAVGGDSGVTGVAKYTNGVIVYVGAQKGLMAGGSIGLQMFKYKSIEEANSIYD
jgi:lipid-binding SYLF domain-containing protein